MKRRGFTLIEVIISALILALTVAGLMASFLMAKGSATRANRNMQAMNFCRQTLEELKDEVRADTWLLNNQPLSTGAGGWGPWQALVGSFGSRFSAQRRYKVGRVPGVDEDAGYRKVTVVVDWQEP